MPSLGFPRDVQLEAFLNGWTDVTSELRETRPITFSHGQSAEQSSVASSYFTATMDNESGNWTQENPLGAYYGRLGPNTPMRVSLKVASDTFDNRTSGSSWGTSTSGDVWTTVSGNPSVTGGKGRLTFNDNTVAILTGPNIPLKNAYVRFDFTPSITVVTGNTFEVGVMFRRQDASNYYFARVAVSGTDQAYLLQVWRITAGVFTRIPLSGGEPAVGFHTAGQTVSIAAAIEGRTVLMKLWPAGQPEPLDWVKMESDYHADDAIDEPGLWGIRAGFQSGNTNVKPITADFDNIEVKQILASGFADINDQWDLSHADRNAAIRVNGKLKTVLESRAPVKSALRRAYENDTTGKLKAYWSCEDGEVTSGVSASMLGIEDMSVEGQPRFRSNTDFPSSADLPTMNLGMFVGEVPYHVATGQVMVRLLISIPSSGAVNNAVILRLVFPYQGTNLGSCEVRYTTGGGGGLQFTAYDNRGIAAHTSPGIGFAMDGHPKQLQLDLRQNGANIDFTLSELTLGASSGGFYANTIAGQVMGPVSQIAINPLRTLDSVAIGHIFYRTEIISMYTEYQELNAFNGEDHLDRFIRLCQQNNIAYGFMGDNGTGTPMGYQRPDTLANLFEQCRAANQGLYGDMRTTPGLWFRNRETIESQAVPALPLDYSAGQVSEPFRPATEELAPRNDVRGARVDGGEYRYTKSTGSKNVNEPGTDPDAVGRFEAQLPFNVATESGLRGPVQFDVSLATSKARRWPEVSVDLSALELASATLQAAVLALAVGDRVTVDNATETRQYQTIDLLALGYSMVLSEGGLLHRYTVNTDKYAPWRAFTFGLAGHDVLDTKDTTLAEDLDTTEVDIDVLAPSAAWITTATHPTHFPVDIVVGGEIMRVTSAVSLGSNVYRLTVTRSTNAVVKTHLTGAAVRIADLASGVLARR